MHDLDGFTEYVTGNAYRLKRVSFLLTGNDADAQDLLQTTLAKLYLGWPRITAAGNPDAYVRRALVTTHRSIRRRHWWRETPAASLRDHADDTSSTSRTEDRLVLRAALITLSPRQRQVVVLRYYADLSERDTAEALGCSVGTVKTLASRGLARLRSVLPPTTGAAVSDSDFQEAPHGTR